MTTGFSPSHGTTIIVGAAIHQDPKTLARFLESLDRQRVKGYAFRYCFVNDNGDKYPESTELLIKFAKTHDVFFQTCPKRNQDYTNHKWSGDLVDRVAKHKNNIIRYFLAQNGYWFPYLFLIDSDLVIRSNLIEHLMSLNKKMVAEVFWTKWPGMTGYNPQCWEYDLASISISNSPQDRQRYYEKLQIPGTYQVGMTGACTLLQRSVLEAGVDFSPIPNLTIPGEDRWFCIRAACHNIPIHINTDYPAYHIYTPDLLDGVDKYIEEIEDPNYLSNRKKKFDIK